jgi:hypothetical protein
VPALGDENVRGLDVTVNDPLGVCGVEGKPWENLTTILGRGIRTACPVRS